MKYILLRGGLPISLVNLEDVVGWWWLDPKPDYQLVRLDKRTTLLNQLRGLGALVGAKWDDGLGEVHYG